MRHWRWVFMAALLGCGVWIQTAAARAATDCGAAKGAVEQALCAHTDLKAQDAQLNAFYRALWRAAPADRHRLHATEVAWLATRDACGAGYACLAAAYTQRVKALREQLIAVLAYKPDATDRAALADLRAAVEQARRHDPEFALEDALKSFEVKRGVTTFENTSAQDADDADAAAVFPDVRPKGVTADEWRALQTSRDLIAADGENGAGGYTLIDLDGDGKRDLVVDTYAGGTGIWDYVETYRRQGDRFVATPTSSPWAGGDPEFDSGDAGLYATNGRGANESTTFVRLRGRTYVAYVEGDYGEDDVYLLNPLAINHVAPMLEVDYRYHFTVPIKQPRDDNDDGATVTLDAATHAAVVKAVGNIAGAPAGGVPTDGKPICPVPPGTQADDRDAYYQYGAGGYQTEPVADLPLWLHGRCYVARVIDWFGSYSRDGGLAAMLLAHLPEGGGDVSYTLSATRSVKAVTSRVAIIRSPNAGLQ